MGWIHSANREGHSAFPVSWLGPTKSTTHGTVALVARLMALGVLCLQDSRKKNVTLSTVKENKRNKRNL